MAASQSHIERERAVLVDLESSFPNFTGQAQSWTEVPAGQDPPDFTSPGPNGLIGLELVEWLDGNQMGPAKTRESQRDQVRRILTRDWEKEYHPKNFKGAFPSLVGDTRIPDADELPLRREFFACAAEIDRNWRTDEDHWGNQHYQTDFSSYPTLAKYFTAMRYIGGEPHGLCWIGEQGDGGAFDPTVPTETLKHRLDSKLSDYATPEKQAHLKAQALAELDLLVHGGFNIFAYNTPSGRISLEQISRSAADYYAAHPQRDIFERVWFFHSLDSADEVNQLIGFAPREGRVRWLAQIWPDFKIYPGVVVPGRDTPVGELLSRDQGIELYKTTFETWRSQVDSYWQRSNYFAAFETAALTGGWILVSSSRIVEVGAGVLFILLGIGLTVVWHKNNEKVRTYVRHWWDSLRECERILSLTPYNFTQQLEDQQEDRNKKEKAKEYRELIQWVPKLFGAGWIILLAGALIRFALLWCRYGHPLH